MSNKDVFKELYSKYLNKEKNYNKILENIERNKKGVNKYLKWSFIPMCLVAIIVGILFVSSKNSNSLLNPNIPYIDETNTTNDTNFEIYKISSECDVLWISPEALYENSDLVVLANYENDIKSYPGVAGIPMTLSNFNVKKVYKGNLQGKTTIPVNYRGGSITLEEYLSAQPPQSRIAKQGYDNISEEKRKYILIEYESSIQDFSFKETPENYILFLDFDEDSNSYSTLSGDYGISKVNEKGQMYDYLRESYVDVPFDK